MDSDICGDDGIDVWVGDISLLLAGDVNELIYIIKPILRFRKRLIAASLTAFMIVGISPPASPH